MVQPDFCNCFYQVKTQAAQFPSECGHALVDLIMDIAACTVVGSILGGSFGMCIGEAVTDNFVRELGAEDLETAHLVREVSSISGTTAGACVGPGVGALAAVFIPALEYDRQWK